MIKTKNKKSLFSKVKRIRFIYVSVFVLALLQIFTLLTFTDSKRSLMNYEQATSDNILKQTSEGYQTRFCYEKNIKPCDQVAIDEWNATHPDDSFHTFNGFK